MPDPEELGPDGLTATGDFPLAGRVSWKAERARVRGTEASRRGRQNRDKSRRQERGTVDDLEKALVGVRGAYVEDRHAKEKKGIVVGIDVIAHVPGWGLAVQCKKRDRPSLRKAWREVTGGMSSLNAEYMPCCRLEWSYTQNPHMDLAFLRPADLSRLLGYPVAARCISGKSLRLKDEWKEEILITSKLRRSSGYRYPSLAGGGFPHLQIDLTGLEPLHALDWTDFLDLYRQAVTR